MTSVAATHPSQRNGPMDLPPLQLEMLRLNLRPTPAPPQCHSSPTPGLADPDQSLTWSVTGLPACPPRRQRPRIDEPHGWPPMPPPPVSPATAQPPVSPLKR
ncbi:MAG: hypothetical protein HQ527_05870 [Cyanobacteria bacterium]|nr:hypothetical protein [Cyanobacteria bacterium bin.51]